MMAAKKRFSARHAKASDRDMSLGGRDLVTSHMESHYRRVSSAKGRVDTGAPAALLKCVRVHDRCRQERNTHTVVSTPAKKTTNCNSDKNTMTGGQNPKTTHLSPMAQLAEVKPLAQQSPRWELYHTKTGRTTGFYQELRMNKQQETDLFDESIVQHPSPWKPGFTPALQTILKPRPQECSTPRTTTDKSPKSATKCFKHKQVHRQVQFNKDCDALSPRNRLDTTHTVSNTAPARGQDSNNIQQTTVTEFELVSNDSTNPNHSENDKVLISLPLVNSSDHSPSVLQTATVHQKEPTFLTTTHRLFVAEKNFERRIMLKESSLELKYLEFLSSITKDILTRRSFSDAGIDVIIRSHVAANKHRLREDVMWQKIVLLRRELDLASNSTATSATNTSS